MLKHTVKTFDIDKLPEYTERFADKKAAVIGAGAVGSLAVESLVKMGCKDVVIIDYDKLEDGNISKSSSLFRYPDDVGTSKAITLARRANEILMDDCVHGINSMISDFGPMAFAGYDVVILALDNYAAKVYFNQIWKQIPDGQKPLLISGGTYEEIAQSNCFDGNDACLRCTFDEEWLEKPLEKLSCLNIQFRLDTVTREIVRTSGLASGITAHLMSEQCRNWFLGDRRVANKRLMYYPYPNLSLNEYKPMKRDSCPDCRDYHPAVDPKSIPGADVLHTSVGDLIRIFDEIYAGREYEIMLPAIEYAKVSYAGLIKTAHCACCGEIVENIYRHPFHTKANDIVCDKCRSKASSLTFRHQITTGDDGELIEAINHENCDDILSSKSLSEIGFQIGALIEARIKTGDGIDIMDDGFITELFYCENDQRLLKEIVGWEV